MKKGLLLNSDISAIIAQMGHTDQLTIADAGLPIPQNIERIDLAITRGTPSFMSVLLPIIEELQVEKVTFAEEFEQVSPKAYKEVLAALLLQNSELIIETTPHENFKTLTAQSKAIIRTGECTPYVNVILHSGVSF